MKKEQTKYECDGLDCKESIVTGPHEIRFGPDPLRDWIVLENGICFCSVKCFLSEREEYGNG